MADFFRRRLGEEVLAKAVDPFVGGVFAGDPETLLMAECLPGLAAAEREAGSMALGMWRRWRRGDARCKRMCTLPGLSSLGPAAGARSGREAGVSGAGPGARR